MVVLVPSLRCFEILVQDFDDEIRVLPRLPRDWRSLSFDGVRAPGAFLVGGTVEQRHLQQIRVVVKLADYYACV